jgi:hypothetical protein
VSVTEESAGVAFDPELLLAQGVTEGVQVDVMVDGVPVPIDWVATPTECAHSLSVLLETVVAFVKEDPEDPAAPAVEWQARVRAQCGECGLPFDIAPTGRVPRDGGRGVVLALRPAEG